MADTQYKEKTSRISYVVFILTLSIVIINNVSLIFPALIASLDKNFEIYVDPFRTGPYAIPVLVINLIVFSFLYLYLTKKLPNVLKNLIKFILKFEISHKTAVIVIVILLGGYVAFTIQDLSIDENEELADFKYLKLFINEFPHQVEEGRLSSYFVKYFLLSSSQTIFQNMKILPFISSISLLLVTYFLTVEISKKRFAGIIAMVILLQSSIFLRYDTVATYSNFWTVFFILSLYLVYKRWYLSPVTYFLSIFSKALTVFFFPMILFFTYRACISKKKKIRIVLTYTVTFAIASGIYFALNTTGGDFASLFDNVEDFNAVNFLTGFSAWAIQFRFDVFILLFTLPLTIGLFIVSRKGVLEADSILVLIFGILLLAPLLTTFTLYSLQPYRFLPLVVFFAVGVGTLLSKKITQSA